MEKTLVKQILEEYRDLENKKYYEKRKRIALEIAWLKEHKDEGCKCGRRYDLTIDHIIPDKLLKEFGINIETYFEPRNFRVLCRICNVYKSDRLDFADPRTKKLLLEFINQIPNN